MSWFVLCLTSRLPYVEELRTANIAGITLRLNKVVDLPPMSGMISERANATR